MKKNDLLREVSKKATNSEVRYTKADAEAILTAYGEVVKEYLAEEPDDRVALFGLGNFKTSFVKGREGVSALTGKAFKTEDRHKLVFKVSPDAKTIG